MSLYIDFKGNGYPFIVDRGRNQFQSSQPSPIEEDSEAGSDVGDVEMASEPSSSDLESTAPVATRSIVSGIQRAVQPALDFLMPQGPVVPFAQIPRAAQPAFYPLVMQGPSVPLSPVVRVLPATDQPPAEASVLSNVEDKPVVLAFPVQTGFKYTKKFIENLAGQFFYSYVSGKRQEVTLQEVKYDTQWARVKQAQPEEFHWIALSRLKRADLQEKYLLVRQNDGNYALGSYLQQGQRKIITWEGSNATKMLSFEGDDNLARFIPVSQGKLDTCFSRIENAYRAAIDSTQLIPAYQLNL